MKNWLSRVAPQGSVTAVTAMAVALLTFHGQSLTGNNPASLQTGKATTDGVRHVSGTRSGPAGGVTKVDFDPYVGHHPWS